MIMYIQKGEFSQRVQSASGDLLV